MQKIVYTNPSYSLLETHSVLISHYKNWMKVENFRIGTSRTHQFNGEIEGFMISADQASLLIYTSGNELANICSKTLNKTHELTTRSDINYALHLNSAGNILCVYDDSIEVYTPDLSRVIFKAKHFSDYLLPEIIISGEYIICQEDSSTLEIWHVESSASFLRIQFDNGKISDFEITPNMKFLSVTFENGDYQVYEIPSRRCILSKPSTAEVILFPNS